MATAKAGRKRYQATMRIWIDVGLDFNASDLEDAVEAAKHLKLTDAITILGDHDDSGYRITSVFEHYVTPTI